MLIRLYGGWKFGGCGQCKFGGDYKEDLWYLTSWWRV